jgi:hypothetical protein
MDYRFSPSGLTRLRGPFVTLFTSLLLLRVLQALGSRPKTRRLHTCGADNYGDIVAELNLPQSQYDSLLSILEDLEDLRLCIYYKDPILFHRKPWKPTKRICIELLEPDETSAVPTWFDLIIKVAPVSKY